RGSPGPRLEKRLSATRQRVWPPRLRLRLGHGRRWRELHGRRFGPVGFVGWFFHPLQSPRGQCESRIRSRGGAQTAAGGRSRSGTVATRSQSRRRASGREQQDGGAGGRKRQTDSDERIAIAALRMALALPQLDLKPAAR